MTVNYVRAVLHDIDIHDAFILMYRYLRILRHMRFAWTLTNQFEIRNFHCVLRRKINLRFR